MSVKAQSLIDFCSDEGRVCPSPISWNAMWKMLCDTDGVESDASAPKPLILSAWWATTDGQKCDRLMEQIIWASANGAYESANSFLRALADDQWHYRKSSIHREE